jgi:ABC-type multidrug transport system fused ATPase/permease subunit
MKSKKLTISFSSAKKFFKTFKSTVLLAWQTNKKYFLFITIAGALEGLLVYPELIITKNITDNVLKGITTGNYAQPLQIIIILTLTTICINQIQQLITDYADVYSNTLSGLIKETINIKISRKINSLPVPVAENPETRNTFQKVQDASGNAINAIINPLSSFPTIIFGLVSTSILIIKFNWLIVIPSIIFVAPRIGLGVKRTAAWRVIRNIYSPTWRVWGALDDFANKGKYLYENKILGHVNILLNRRLKIAVQYFKDFEKHSLRFSKLQRVYSAPIILFENGTKLYLFYLAMSKVMSLGTAQSTNQSINRFVSYVSRLIRESNNLYQNYTFINDYENFLAIPDEDTQGTLLNSKLNTGLEFKNVWFKYQSSPDWNLKNLSFSIKPTENIAIVGENGAGKTTLIKLICRFYKPQRGQITLDGKDIYEYDLVSYRQSLAALFQDFAQYPFSAKDNIHFGDVKKKLKLKEIKKVAKYTDMDHFIDKLPLKYNNPLDKEFAKGIEPSKGQWQRIALSRTLYRDAHIIILDEPTSNVDPESEEKIFESIMKIDKDKMIFLVSHRFSTVRKADKILVIEEGVLIEEGSHNHLMKNKSRYHELFNLQAQSYQ